MRTTITAFLAIAVMAATIAQGTPEQDRLWSTRVTCELQTAGAQSLPTLTFSQGSTPLLSLDQYRAGKSVNADSNIVARLVFGPTQTNQYYVAVTNYAVSGNGYLIQCPTIGTNTTAGAWWYTAYFESATGHRYWTGNGRVSIVATTSTADGLSWQEFVSGDSITPDELAAALLAYEPVLPSTPTNPASKYLNGNREWSSISDGVVRVRDSAQPSRYVMEVVNSTGTVYEVTGPYTNLMVTLSDDFEETVTHTRPAWTNNVFPFTDGSWYAFVTEGYVIAFGSEEAYWHSETLDVPAILAPYYNAKGTATVSVASVYYTTNAIKHFSTEAELEAAKAACGVVLTNTVNEAVSNLTADISASTNALMPYSRTVYADITKTNYTGYAAFNATNAAVESYSALIPSSAVGSFTNIFRYNFNGVRKFGTLTNTAWFVKSGFGAGYKAVSTVVSVKDAAGNVLASSASQPVNIDLTVTTQAAITNTLAIPLNVYSGTVEVACIAVSTNASFSVRLYTGGQYASSLSFGEAPIPYATVSDVSGLILGGATNITDGVTAGTYDDATRTLNVSNITAKLATPSGVTNIVTGMVVVTNGSADATIGRVRLNSDTVTAYYGKFGYSMEDVNLSTIAPVAGQGNAVFFRGYKDDWSENIIRLILRGDGSVEMPSGRLVVAGTNTAAVVSSQGPVLLGPSIGGKQAHIFTDGTNCFFVNVNSVTNALTTN